MKNDVFDLTTTELQEIAETLCRKIEEGLRADGMEILAVPTHITSRADIPDGKALALDWGGTNFRAAIVEYKGGVPTITEGPVKKVLDAKTTAGFRREDLFREMADTIGKLKTLNDPETRIGYCFSYPTASRLNGDAILLHMSKGMDFPEMVGQPVGQPLVEYLNSHKGINTRFTDIKVINDTVACLFAGLGNTGFDSYIGLIVGTGNNMACLMPLDKIKKLNSTSGEQIPINLESGNFNPPYLTVIDGLVDSMSNNKGKQRYEKTLSGAYLGEIFKTAFMNEKVKYNFNGGDLADMINYPESHSSEQVSVARAIYERSARMVAAGLAGLVKAIVDQNPEAKNICLAADGSVFWSKDRNGGAYYRDLVEKELETLLPEGVKVTILPEMSDPNLIGAAIAVLS